jgi:glutamate--cysteine ligase
MHELARQCVAIAKRGLAKRARAGAGGLVADETHFLNALEESVETGRTLADDLLHDYQETWNGDLSKIYAAHAY